MSPRKTRQEKLETRRAWRKANPERMNLIRERARLKMTPQKRRENWIKSMAKPSVRSKALVQQTAWHKANPERVKAAATKCYRKRSQNPKWIVASRLRARIYDALEANQCRKTESFRELVGCSLSELRFWIESQFKPGMSWSERSKWHIDHKNPVAEFDLTDIREQKLCFHYTNLQPLWRHENVSKGRKILPFQLAA